MAWRRQSQVDKIACSPNMRLEGRERQVKVELPGVVNDDSDGRADLHCVLSVN